jgi:hypothetical protein
VGSINKKITVQAHETKIGDPIPKITKAKGAGSMAQMVKHLLASTCSSSNPSTANKQTNNTQVRALLFADVVLTISIFKNLDI